MLRPPVFMYLLCIIAGVYRLTICQSHLSRTKLHCRNVHGMEREEVRERYGMPTVVGVKSGFGGASNINLWNSTSNNSGNLF